MDGCWKEEVLMEGSAVWTSRTNQQREKAESARGRRERQSKIPMEVGKSLRSTDDGADLQPQGKSTTPPNI